LKTENEKYAMNACFHSNGTESLTGKNKSTDILKMVTIFTSHISGNTDFWR